MRYAEVEVSKIIESKYNPTMRTDKDKASYKSLKENIKKNGLLNPVLLAYNGKSLVAGHRRLNADHQDTMQLTAAQETERYLMGAKCISTKTFNAIKRLEVIGGRETIKRVVKEGKSPNTYLIGIDYYVGHIKKRGVLKSERDALYWMFNVGKAYQLKAAIKSFADAEMIRDCVENRKPLEIDWLK